MLVFQTLVETLGCDLYLWMIAVLVMQSAACSKQMPTSSGEQEWSVTGVDADSMFCINIYEQFSAKTQMSALTNVLHFVQKLTLCHKPEALTPRGRSTGRKQRKIGIVDMTLMSPQEMRLFQYHLTKLIASVLQHEAFIGRIVADLEGKSKDDTSQVYFKQFVQEVLTYMTSVASLYGQQSATEIQARFWKALISKVYDILDKVNYLLPTDSLLEVVGSLVTHDLLSVRRKALDLLITKLQQLEPDSVRKSDVKSLLQLVDVVTSIAEDDSGGKEAEFVNCRQHALFSLKLICRLVAHQHPQYFVKLYDIVVPMLSEEELPVPVLGVNLLCLAELCSALKAHSIGKLGAFVPPLINLLGKQDYLLETDMLLACLLVAIQKVLSTLPHFLSPYLLDITLLISQLSDKVLKCDDRNKKAQCVNRIADIRQLLCSDIAPRVLIPTLSDSCDSLIQSTNPNGLKFVAQVAEEHIRSMKKEDLSAQHSALVNFFCKALDLRNATKLKLSLYEIGEIEDGFIDGVLAMVVKLSENSFRPMYYKLYDWACREDNTTTRNRQLAFFKISRRLAEKLKGLFNLFVGHSLQSMCQTLEANRSNTPEVDFYESNEIGAAKSCELLTNIIDCLYKCMLHDNDGLFQKDIFKVVMQPLVDQIDNYVGGAEEYEKRIMNSVVPCISQLSVAAKDDPGWKSLNYQVALKTRHKSPKVRFGALQVEEEIANKLGEEFMVLLPEVIPFLAELMEDEVEEVEQKCQEVIRSIEQAVNEDLQKYF